MLLVGLITMTKQSPSRTTTNKWYAWFRFTLERETPSLRTAKNSPVLSIEHFKSVVVVQSLKPIHWIDDLFKINNPRRFRFIWSLSEHHTSKTTCNYSICEAKALNISRLKLCILQKSTCRRKALNYYWTVNINRSVNKDHWTQRVQYTIID